MSKHDIASDPCDSAGNLTANPAGTYSYDHLSMVTQVTGTGKNEQYIYTADDERLAKLPAPGLPGSVKWSLRGLGAEVLRTYSSTYSAELGFSLWFWKEDYVYRGSSLLGPHKPDQIYSYQKHFHLDHLGTSRLRTDDIGQIIETHKYLPYGEVMTPSPVGSETMRFTGHERDEDPTGFGNDLDYMHARYYSPRMGRFLSLDPKIRRKPTRQPQRWNRYTYSLNNPVRYVDPDGLTERTVWKAGTVRNNSLRSVWIAADKDGVVLVVELKKGEFSTEYFSDTDAVVIGPDEPIDGVGEGAYKIGTQDIGIEEDSDGNLYLDLDNIELIPNWWKGTAGFVSKEEARSQGWVVPSEGGEDGEEEDSQKSDEADDDEEGERPPPGNKKRAD